MVLDMKLTIDEISTCLDLPLKKVERWISQGRIPVKKDGRVCVFSESALEKWAIAHHLPFRLPNDISQKEKVSATLPDTEVLQSAMKRGGVIYNVEGTDAESVLEAAVMMLPDFSDESKQLLLQRLQERERLMSTGIGKGVAIPHPRTPLEKMGDASLLTTLFLKNPVDFGSIDDKPVFVLFLLLSPTTRKHLNLLSRLAFCVRDDTFVSFLKTAPGAMDLFSKIAALEQQLDQS